MVILAVDDDQIAQRVARGHSVGPVSFAPGDSFNFQSAKKGGSIMSPPCFPSLPSHWDC